MNPELKALAITAKELERLTGFEVNDLFIGSIVGGNFRPGIFKSPKRILSFGLMQVFALILSMILTLPVGLVFVRNNANAVSDLATISRFLQVTLSVTIALVIGWNLTMSLRKKAFLPLARLLDEVDQYNDVVRAVDVMDRLDAIGTLQAQTSNRHQAIDAIAIARSSLVCGLMTEKILRQNRSLLARRADLVDNIEANLVSLRTLEVNNQASEYVELLNEALKIGMSVQQEVQQLSRSKSSRLV
ncbi:hypothetical protein [Stenomitos frigidus]|uniref:Uncharacterized protein n=1 Tax=Stenomitos frigidus ULC18 TaxID=2107698 RepID=A0A2T1DYA6_9CYAN|nr:hypothetical protein [Stenomitos frigidus]PSB25486.1 hypothetical protein C7B82_22945 [Stenomitos frigidus ULC18]